MGLYGHYKQINSFRAGTVYNVHVRDNLTCTPRAVKVNNNINVAKYKLTVCSRVKIKKLHKKKFGDNELEAVGQYKYPCLIFLITIMENVRRQKNKRLSEVTELCFCYYVNVDSSSYLSTFNLNSSILAKFRCRNHHLPFESGCRRCIPCSLRICDLCKRYIGDDY